MAVPTIDNVTTAVGTGGTGNVTGSLPSGSGDLLVAWISVDNDNDVTATGWTAVRAYVPCGGTSIDVSGKMFTAPATVSNFTFTWTTDTARVGLLTILRVSGASGVVNASNYLGEPTGNQTSTTRAIPSLTTTVNDCLLVCGVGCDSTTTGGSYNWPTGNGWTERSDITDAGTAQYSSTGTSSQATAGTITGGDITTNVIAGDHHAIIVAAFEPSGGSNNWTRTVDDSAGLADSTMGLPLALTFTDSAGLTDNVTGLPASPLPGLIDGIEPEASGGFQGPYIDGNGCLYRITEEYLGDAPGLGNHVMVMKSADGGGTWTRQDATNSPGYDDGTSGTYNDLESAWLLHNPSAKQLYVLWCKAQSRWFSATFNTSDHATAPDTFVTAETPGTGGWDTFATTASESGISGAVLSNGDLQAFVRGEPQSSLEAFKWRKRSGTTWADKGYITDSVGMSRPSSVVGESDKVYLFYRDLTNGQVRYKTITSTDTVSASARVDSGGAGASNTTYMNNVVPPVYYSDAGTPVVVVGFVNGSNVLRTVEVRGGSVGSEQVVSTDTVVVDPMGLQSATDNQGPSAALAVYGTTVYALWSDTTSGDVWYATRPNGGSWSSKTQLVNLGSGEAAHWLYANRLTKPNGTVVLGYTYDVGPHNDDDSNIYYNELVLFTPGGGGSAWVYTCDLKAGV